MVEFKPAEFEKKWREKWEVEGVYVADLNAKEKFYNLWMFPYPSAEGVHVGTIFSSTGSDVYGRYKRMQGKEVFQPMGYDSFGIHSENFALKIGEPPGKFTKRAVANYERQFKEIGHGYDWTRTVSTSTPEYYKWTQWLFIQMWKAGLAYKKKSAVNWCPGCKTVLADEQIMSVTQAGKWPKDYTTLEEVPEGMRVCERCGNVPERKELEQWFFKITEYADRLLEGQTRIDWSDRVAVAQREWIGRKIGVNVKFEIRSTKFEIKSEVFTTRIDTIMGVTFLVVAPEVAKYWTSLGWVASLEVNDYINKALNSTEEKRKKGEKEKTGVKTDLTAVNPVSGVKVPVYVADYVLKDVGTGVVMGVPAMDVRDLTFAEKHELPIVNIELEDLDEITRKGNREGWAKSVTTYHLRDWLISRQRYWGPPIPMINCEKCARLPDGQGWRPVPEEQLPVLLPEIDDYQPRGEGKGPLANHPEFYETTCPECGGKAVRETDVMDTFVDSAWYFLRYPSASSENVAWNDETTKKWLPVDLYFGGAEHSVLHLMYARFVTKVLYDLKLVDFDEPFPRFFAHGLMIKDGAKMSKSRGNVVNPDEYIKKYGADALRLYLMFMGPMDGYPDFRDSGMEGMVRWLRRVWKLVTGIPVEENQLDGMVNNMITKVTDFLENYKNNTAIAEMMKFVNEAERAGGMTLKQIDIFTKLLSPFAPHICEEVWCLLGKPFSIHRQAWPVRRKDARTKVTMVVQVAGKVRGKFETVTEISEDSAIAKALELENVKKFLPEKYTVVFVPEKVVNFV